jgi:phosphatidylglycerol:prolipoprotein diacylglycerol transferase
VADHQLPSDAWSWSVALGYTDPSAMATVPLHPTQIYEAFGDLALAGLVILLVRSQGPTRRAAWLHLGGYATLRCALEFLHGDRDVLLWAGMTALQLGLLAFAVVSAVLFVRETSASAH